MKVSKFFTILLGITSAILIIIYVLRPYLYFKGYEYFSYSLIGIYAALNIIFYFLSKSSAKKTNLNTYSNLVIISIGMRLFITLIFVLIFVKTIGKPGAILLASFAIIYIPFTIFEAYFMIKMGKNKLSHGEI